MVRICATVGLSKVMHVFKIIAFCTELALQLFCRAAAVRCRRLVESSNIESARQVEVGAATGGT